ncbi:hypothetical protein [Actinoplanes sp. NPDC049681]|uniref:hypothetical protein n=1 Tax=Actinoplanes sp. NPDC049681 TaxID=3363905 RepID=UPI0037AB445D
MTAATMTRTAGATRSARSAFPAAVDELIPLARDYAAELGATPTRNQLMKRFRIGAPKARTVLAALAPSPDTAESEPGRTVLLMRDEAAPLVPSPPAAGPAMPEQRDEAGPEPIDTDTRGPELAHIAALFARGRHAETAPPDDYGAAGEPARADGATAQRSRAGRYTMGALLTVVGMLLAGVIVAPIALSSQDIIAWAASPTGLGLAGPWPWVTFFALDAAAAVCVGLVVYCAWRGESAGVFAWLVWAFAGMSAYANYSHSSGSAARDAVWFFPAMSLAGPFLLEIVVRRVRRWVQEGTRQRVRHAVAFGLARWIPGVGALRETYGAWRLARLDGIDDADQAVTAYRRLCPDGSIRVLAALRERSAASAQLTFDSH